MDQVDLEGPVVAVPPRGDGAFEWVFPAARCEVVEKAHAVRAPCVVFFDVGEWRVRWARTIAATPRHGATLIGDWVIVDTSARVLSVFERAGHGRLYWEVELDDDIAQKPEDVESFALVRDGDRAVWLLDLPARRRVWVYRAEAPIRGRPKGAAGQIIVETAGGLVAVDQKSGERLWQRPEAIGEAVVAEGLAHVAVEKTGERSLELLAIEIVNGAIAWRVSTAVGESGPARVCATPGGVSLFASGVVYGIDSTRAGQIRFRQELRASAQVVYCGGGNAVVAEPEGEKSRVMLVDGDGARPAGGAELPGQVGRETLGDERAIVLSVGTTADTRQIALLNIDSGRAAWKAQMGRGAEVAALARNGVWTRESGEFLRWTRESGDFVERRNARIVRSGGGWTSGVRYVVYIVPPSLIALGLFIHVVRRRGRR